MMKYTGIYSRCIGNIRRGRSVSPTASLPARHERSRLYERSDTVVLRGMCEARSHEDENRGGKNRME